MAKDQDGMFAQLIASSKALEQQLQTLRKEHDTLCTEGRALRRCLDRAGVLSAEELEKEIQTSVVARAEASPALAEGLDGLALVPSPCRPATAAAPATEATPVLVASAPGRRQADSPGRSLSPSTCLALHDEARASPPACNRASATAGAATATAGVIAPASPAKGGRGRSLNKSAERTESADKRKGGRPRSRSTRMPADEAEADAVGPEADLYELISSLLDQGRGVVEQQRAMRSVQQLLKRRSEPPNAWAGPGTPLSAVVRAGRSDIARLLLRARANVNDRDAKGVSALHIATYDGNADLCRVLLVGRADVDACDRHGQTPLFFVPSKEICKLLIERRSDVTVLNRKGQSALHLAGRAGLHEVLSWLSSRVSKSLVELRDVHGATARNYAQQSGVPRPEVWSPRTSRGRTPSPRKPQAGSTWVRAPSPQVSLRGGQARAAAATQQPAPLEAEAARSEFRRGSGQLPYVSEFVEGRSNGHLPGDAAGADRVGGRGGSGTASTSALTGLGCASDVAQHAAVVLEAAAAVATAAVATAAELEAAQAAEMPSAPDLTGAVPVADGAHSAATLAPTSEAGSRRSSLRSGGAAQDLDLAELGVVEDDPSAAGCPSLRPDGRASAGEATEMGAAGQAGEAGGADTSGAQLLASDLSELGIVEDTSSDADCNAVDDEVTGQSMQTASPGMTSSVMGGTPDDVHSPDTLRKLEEELDEVF
eukprot:CAMPEP_0168363962 /NCGR_PEP_ID=MMETSP0228-20121227/3963_1 /TAXON_ID=133427 /ORGANISM="Protoceratium reticulatum, Strain CCCM 535 (=CCMP 1889)" /LENGTH=711 /DNA_ID=CAMNT_0008376709 /DNA_START=122 /DNA_END=2257 /DNA_ORIENTATION=+